MKYGASINFLLDKAAVAFTIEGEAEFAGRGLFSPMKTERDERGHAAPSSLGWETKGLASLLTLPDRRLKEGAFLKLQVESWRIASVLRQSLGGETVYLRLALEKCPCREEA